MGAGLMERGLARRLTDCSPSGNRRSAGLCTLRARFYEKASERCEATPSPRFPLPTIERFELWPSRTRTPSFEAAGTLQEARNKGWGD